LAPSVGVGGQLRVQAGAAGEIVGDVDPGAAAGHMAHQHPAAAGGAHVGKHAGGLVGTAGAVGIDPVHAVSRAGVVAQDLRRRQPGGGRAQAVERVGMGRAAAQGGQARQHRSVG
jgi:hypothetical protein